MQWLEGGRAPRTRLFSRSRTGRHRHLLGAPGEANVASGLGGHVGNFPPFRQRCSPALPEQSSSDLSLLTCKNPHYQPFRPCHRSHSIRSSSPRPRSQRLLIMQKNKAPFLITSCSLRAAGAGLKRRTRVVQNSKGK